MATHKQLLARVKALTALLTKSHNEILGLAQGVRHGEPGAKEILYDAMTDANYPEHMIRPIKRSIDLDKSEVTGLGMDHHKSQARHTVHVLAGVLSDPDLHDYAKQSSAHLNSAMDHHYNKGNYKHGDLVHGEFHDPDHGLISATGEIVGRRLSGSGESIYNIRSEPDHEGNVHEVEFYHDDVIPHATHYLRQLAQQRQNQTPE